MRYRPRRPHRPRPAGRQFHSALGRLLVDRLDIDGAVASLRRARALEPGRVEHALSSGSR